MDRSFFEYPFSRHFNHLTYLGMWTAEIFTRPLRRNLFFFFRASLHVFVLFIVSVQMSNLYLVFDDFEKVTFNVCSSFLVIALLIKVCLIHGRRQYINELRLGLWRDYLKLEDEEDFSILNRAYRDLNVIYYCGYAFLFTTYVIIFVTHCHAYSLGLRELPFAASIPLDYPKALFTEAVAVWYVESIALENELIWFSLVLQMNAHYEVLMNKLKRLNQVYGDEEDIGEMKEKKQKKAKEIIKYCVTRHLQLMEYTNKLEHVYSRCMVVQLLVGSFLILMNGVELLVFVREFNRKICSQMLIILMLINDLLLLCHFSSKLTVQCVDVGSAAYSTAWYRMDKSIQKGLYMIMMGSKKPPRVTAGKIILVDLHTYMHLLKNILSWLMLIRQLVNQKK